jgi:hypothetical protein
MTMKQTPKGAKFAVIRGRHRTAAAKLAGIKKLRCNVHADGRLGLYEIDVDDLVVDEMSQIEWTFSEKRAKKIAANWDYRAVGVLDVTPVEGGLTEQERNKLKLTMDRDQRAVPGLETFHNEVGAGDAAATEIKRIVESHKFEIGKNRRNAMIHTRIEAVSTLKSIYKYGGAGLLDRTLTVAELWYDEPGSLSNVFLSGLARFCLDGHDENWTDRQTDRLAALIPMREIKQAQGKAEGILTGSSANGVNNPMAMILSDQLRSKAGIRKLKPTRRAR